MKTRPFLLCALLFLALSPRASFSQSEKPPTTSPLSFRGVARLVKIARHAPTYQADATYPRFLISTPVTRLANWKLRTQAQKGVAALVSQARADAKEIREMKITAYGSGSTPSLHFYAPKRLISVAVMDYSYLGGAHGNYGTDAKNYGLLRGETRPRELNLGDFFRAVSPYRARVEKMLLGKLRATKGAQKEATFVVDGSVKTLPTALLNNFVAEKGGLRWFFPPYAVGPYAVGEFEVKLSLAELGSDFNREMLALSSSVAALNSADFLVTSQRIGKARLGMTIKQLKRAYPDATFELSEDVTTYIVMNVGGQRRFALTTRQFWQQLKVDDDANKLRPPRDADVVVSISTEDARYRTASDIRVGSWLHNAARIYGPPRLDFWTHGERAVFPRLPRFDFGVEFGERDLAGFYSAQEIKRSGGTATRFRRGAKITSMGISQNRFFQPSII